MSLVCMYKCQMSKILIWRLKEAIFKNYELSKMVSKADRFRQLW